MLGLFLTALALSSSLVYAYEGVPCGDFNCVNDPNVICNQVTKSCECREGYAGNGRVMCALNTTHICTMIGDPHIVTFNKEVSKILMPCQNILTQLDVFKPPNPRLYVRVTAIVETSYFARYPAQVVATGLYVELYISGEDPGNQITMQCNDNGCFDTTTSEQYTNFNRPGTALRFTVTRNANNQQVLMVPFYETEIRFRGEDGSFAIRVPTSAVIDSDSGLCNNFLDSPTFNVEEQQRGGYSSLNNYLLFVNQANIPTPDFDNQPTCQLIKDGCQPETRTAQAVDACSVLYTDIPFSTCFYNYRMKNDTVVLEDYEKCREEECANLTPSLCGMVQASGCALTTNYLICQ